MVEGGTTATAEAKQAVANPIAELKKSAELTASGVTGGSTKQAFDEAMQAVERVRQASQRNEGPMRQLDQLLQSADVPFESLSPELQKQYTELSKQGANVPKEAYEQLFERINQETNTKLNEAQKTQLAELQRNFSANPDAFFRSLNQTIQDSQNSAVSAEEKKDASELVNAIQEETKKPEDKQKPQLIQEKVNSLMGILKKLGAIISAIFGFFIYKGFKAGNADAHAGGGGNPMAAMMGAA
jgi:hypothetical protein